ncbi:MAG: hypothetical protein ACRDDY_04125 [Clostridium sp.]|uniref:hypothetical protein n=1 Tax=Clostridium sp. TaxID=1506 RepID=UPI003EE66018
MAKKNIMVKLIIDSREQKTEWVESQFKFDKKYNSEKVMISGYEVHTPFKSLDKNGNKVNTSTGDVGIMYSLDNGDTWKECNLAIELKRDSDMNSTLYSSWKRFTAELQRAEDNGLDFYIVYNQSTREMQGHFAKLKVMKKISFYENPEATYYDRLIDVSKRFPVIYTHEIHTVVRRIVKKYIKEKRLQYEEV